MLEALQEETKRHWVGIQATSLQEFLKIAKTKADPLGLIHFEVKSSELSISYHERQYTLERTMTLYFASADFSRVAVSMPQLSEIMKGLKGDIWLSWDSQNFLVKTAHGESRLAPLESYQISFPDSQPRIPIFSDAILESFPSLLEVVSEESPRAYGSVVNFSVGSKFCLTATDGFRLARYETEFFNDGNKALDGLNLSYRSAKVLHSLSKLRQEISFTLNDDKSQVSFYTDGYRLTARLSSVKFPNCDFIIDTKQFKQQVQLNRKTFLETLKAAKRTTNKTKAVLLSSQFILRSRINETQEFSVYDPGIACTMPHGYALNVQYLIDAFSTFSGDFVQFYIGKTSDDIVKLESKKLSVYIVPIRET